MLTILVPYFTFILSCLITEYLKNSKKYSKQFTVPAQPLTNEEYFQAIKVSLINLTLSTLALYLIFPYLENRFIFYNNTSFYHEGIKFILILLVSDTMFYWTHRFMHIKWIYKYVHKLHHKHINPITFSAFYFHPYELLITWLFVFLFPITIIPLNHITFIFFQVFLLLSLIKSHSRININNKYSSIHHELHHQKFNYNYGSDLGIWDKIMKTSYNKSTQLLLFNFNEIN